MSSRIKLLLIGLLCGISCFWMNEYNNLEIAGIHQYWIVIILAIVASFIAWLVMNETILLIAIWIAIGIVSAQVLRSIYDVTFIDPTHHNLMPFKVIPIMAISFVAALVGSGLQALMSRLKF